MPGVNHKCGFNPEADRGQMSEEVANPPGETGARYLLKNYQ